MVGGTIGVILLGTFSFFYYYIGKDEGSCFASSESNVPVISSVADASDVSGMFHFAAAFFAFMMLFDTLRGFAIGCLCCRPSEGFSKGLKLASLLGVVPIIFIHIFRLMHVGKVCSGDYRVGKETEGYLIIKGQVFWVIIVVFWCIVGLAFLAGLGTMIFRRK